MYEFDQVLGSSGFWWILAVVLIGLVAAPYLRRWNLFSAILVPFTRFVRGFFLILWITILSLVAFNSLTGGLANSVFPAVRQDGSRLSYRSTPSAQCSAAGTLADYLEYREDPPPIGAVLDIVIPMWKNAISCDVTQYQSLLGKIEGRLRSIARQTTDLKTLTVDATILTFEFAEAMRKNPSAEFAEAMRKNPSAGYAAQTLPPEVQDWVARESTRIKDEAQARSLFSTFLLLSVLGAFGALIFLIRDYITLDEEKTLSDYIFRPVLGIFLAVAVFIVDILAHSVISTASILQIRPEPLYILALGAGLLSETAYDWVRRNIDATFARREQQLRSEHESQGTPPTHPEAPSLAVPMVSAK